MVAKPRHALLVLLLGTVCGAGVVWALNPADPHDPGEVVSPADAPVSGGEAHRTEPPASGPPDGAILSGGERATAHFDEVTDRNESLHARVTELKETIARLEPEAVARDPKAFRFGISPTAAAFDKAQWSVLGGHMLELAKVLTNIRREVLAGGQPSAASMKGIQKHNTPLAVFALSIASEMGEEAHVAYTHPAVIANLLRSSLVELGDPLTHGQEIAIATLGGSWLRENEQRTWNASTPQLAVLTARAEAKLRFNDDVKAVLTTSQRDLLFDPVTEGRIQLDLLSPAWMFSLRRPLPHADRAAMETGLLESLFELAEVEVADKAPFAWIARQWVDDLPGALEPKTPRSEDVVFPHIDDLLAQARSQVHAIERLVGMGVLPEADAEALRGVTYVLHPFLTATILGWD